MSSTKTMQTYLEVIDLIKIKTTNALIENASNNRFDISQEALRKIILLLETTIAATAADGFEVIKKTTLNTPTSTRTKKRK